MLFLISINYLSDNLTVNAKPFTDDTSLFSVIHDVKTPPKEFNDDLKNINIWAFQCKMSFNADPSKQAQKVIFSHKSKWPTHPPSVFNNNNSRNTWVLY